MSETTIRAAEPGELCTCGRQAVEVYEGGPFGVTGACGIPDGGDRSGPCRFCGEPRTSHGGRCPRYVLRPVSPDAVMLGAAYARSCEVLDELLAVAAIETAGADYVAVWSGLASSLRGGEHLAELAAAMVLRLLAAAQNRDLAAEEIARLNARLDITRAHEEMGTAL